MTKFLIPIFIFVLCVGVFSAPSPSHATPPAIAGTLSLIPGLGQISNGDTFEGLAWFTTITGGLVASSSLTPNQPWPFTSFLDLWMYNTYDAYRDAGAVRATKQNVFQNYITIFNPLNLIDWVAPPVIAYKLVTRSTGPRQGPASRWMQPFAMGFIALGEEGLFRGFLFSGIAQVTNSAILGAAISSPLFAAFHVLYAGQSQYALQPAVFGMRTTLGLLMCLQTYLRKYDIRESIFTHTWFDVIYELKTTGGGVVNSPVIDQPNDAIGIRMTLPISF